MDRDDIPRLAQLAGIEPAIALAAWDASNAARQAGGMRGLRDWQRTNDDLATIVVRLLQQNELEIQRHNDERAVYQRENPQS